MKKNYTDPVTDDIMKDFYNSVRNIRVLTAEEEKDLAVKMRKGDTEAKKTLWEHNIRLIFMVFNAIKPEVINGMESIDLISQGNIGLSKALDKYDPDKGNKFSTYATWWIMQAMRRYLEDNGRIIRIPGSTREQIIELKRVREDLEAKLGRTPTWDEIAAEMKISVERVAELFMAMYDAGSISKLTEDGKDLELTDVVPVVPEDHVWDEKTEEYNKELLSRILYGLTDRERYVLIRRYGLFGHKKMTLEEIGIELGVTRERVRQIQAKAERKLAKRKEAQQAQSE